MANIEDTSPDDRTGVMAAETGLRVLSAFIGAEQMPMLKTLAERTGMHPAKVHRYLVSLNRCNYVEQDVTTGKYRLGPAALQIGFAAMKSISVIDFARPLIQELARVHCQSTILALWAPAGATVVLQELYPAPITMSMQVGGVLPLLTSSTGRTFGAWLPVNQTTEQIASELSEIDENPTIKKPKSRQEVQDMFEEIRRRGMERVIGLLNPAVSAMSVPVFDGLGHIAAVISMFGPIGLLDCSWNGSIATALRAAAHAISSSIGYVEPVEHEHTKDLLPK